MASRVAGRRQQSGLILYCAIGDKFRKIYAVLIYMYIVNNHGLTINCHSISHNSVVCCNYYNCCIKFAAIS